MGKKIAIGCLVLLVIGGVVGGWAFYRFVWTPGRELVASGKQYVEGLKGLGEVAEMDERVDDQSSYVPPEGGLLTDSQVERLLAVQRIVRMQLGSRSDELQAKYDRRQAQPGEEPSLSDAMELWRDFSGVVKAAKRAQVEALNAQSFSVEEYRWVKRQAYAALGAGALAVDLSEVVTAAKEGRFDDLRRMAEEHSADSERGEVPDWVPRANVELVKAHEAELREGAPLALLGV